MAPLTLSCVLNAFDVVVVTVPVVGAAWVIVPGVTVRVKVQVPVSP